MSVVEDGLAAAYHVTLLVGTMLWFNALVQMLFLNNPWGRSAQDAPSAPLNSVRGHKISQWQI